MLSENLLSLNEEYYDKTIVATGLKHRALLDAKSRRMNERNTNKIECQLHCHRSSSLIGNVQLNLDQGRSRSARRSQNLTSTTRGISATLACSSLNFKYFKCPKLFFECSWPCFIAWVAIKLNKAQILLPMVTISYLPTWLIDYHLLGYECILVQLTGRLSLTASPEQISPITTNQI